MGNAGNSEVTATTFIEVMNSTVPIEAGFRRKKATMGWTISSLGQTEDMHV
jgi:hypothetical protein